MLADEPAITHGPTHLDRSGPIRGRCRRPATVVTLPLAGHIARREPLPTPVALIVPLSPARLRALVAPSGHRVLPLREADRDRPRLLPLLALVVAALRRARAGEAAGPAM